MIIKHIFLQVQHWHPFFYDQATPPCAVRYLKCYKLLFFVLASLDPLIRGISFELYVKVQLEKCISKLHHMGTYVHLMSTQATLSVNRGFWKTNFKALMLILCFRLTDSIF
jgi:hypothetical protein